MKYVALVAALCLVSGCTSTSTVEQPDPAAVEQEAPAEKPEEKQAEPGTTRNSPTPLGSKITSADGDWELVINSVNTDANSLIVNEWNDPPADGNVYIMVNATVTYLGDDPQGEHAFATIDYVTADGNTVSLAYVSYDETDFTLIDPLYNGASHTGANAYEVPDSLDGVLAVTPTMFDDKTFVSIK